MDVYGHGGPPKSLHSEGTRSRLEVIKILGFLASFEAGPLGIPSGGIFGPFLAVFLVGGGPKWISGFVT